MIDKRAYYLSCFVAFMIVSNSTILLPFSWGGGYYGVLCCTLFFLMVRHVSQINFSMICFYLVAALSIAFNDIPSFFSPWGRLGTFILLTLIVSPTLMGKDVAVFKLQLFLFIIWFLVIVTGISIFMLLLGMGRNNIAGWFQGAMSHSMLMGPVAALTCLVCLYQLQYVQRKKWMKYLYLLCMIGAYLCLLQTGSRSALIGSIMASASFVYFRYSIHFGRMVSKFTLIGIILAATFPLWSPFADKIVQKNQGETAGLNVNSREQHWNQRMTEWESSPIYGIGFSSVDIESESSNFDVSTGGVETGSSWLSVLSMTGILGAGCIMYIFISAFLKCKIILKQSETIGALLLSILVFFIFHMMAEGYILAGGNFLNTLLWLLLGVIYSISQYPQYVTYFKQKLQFGK